MTNGSWKSQNRRAPAVMGRHLGSSKWSVKEKAVDADPHVSSSTPSPGTRPRSRTAFAVAANSSGKGGPVHHPVAVGVEPPARGRLVPPGVDHQVLDAGTGQAVGDGHASRGGDVPE